MHENVKRFLYKYTQGGSEQDAAFYKMFRKAANAYAGVNGKRFTEMEKEIKDLKRRIREVVALNVGIDRDVNGLPVTTPLYMCASCEAIYQDEVTECDCTVGESPDWIEGFAVFPKQNVEDSHAK